MQDELFEEEGRKQGVGHIPVTTDEVLQSDGDERWKWMKAGRTELDNLKNTGTVTAISSEKKEELRREARATGQQFVELLSKDFSRSNLTSTRSGSWPAVTRLLIHMAAFPPLILTQLFFAISCDGLLHLLSLLLLPWMLRRLSSMHHCLRVE